MENEQSQFELIGNQQVITIVITFFIVQICRKNHMKPLKTGIPAANDTERKKEEMKNRVLAISLAVVLCIGLLAGCGGSGGILTFIF